MAFEIYSIIKLTFHSFFSIKELHTGQLDSGNHGKESAGPEESQIPTPAVDKNGWLHLLVPLHSWCPVERVSGRCSWTEKGKTTEKECIFYILHYMYTRYYKDNFMWKTIICIKYTDHGPKTNVKEKNVYCKNVGQFIKRSRILISKVSFVKCPSYLKCWQLFIIRHFCLAEWV